MKKTMSAADPVRPTALQRLRACITAMLEGPEAGVPGPKPRVAERWKLWSLALAVTLGGKIPRRLAYLLAALAGDFAYFMRRETREAVEDNMRHVLGPRASSAALRRHAREAFRSVARYYIDLIRLPELRRVLDSKVRIHGLEKITTPMSHGQGVVVVSAHLGNSEVAVQVAAILRIDVLTLAEPLQPPAFARIMTGLRAIYGARYEDVSYRAVANAIRQLRSGRAVALMCDRDIQGTGVPLEFFGARTRLPLGAVDLATRTGSLVVPTFCVRRNDGFEIYFEDPIELVNTGRPAEDALTNAASLLRHAERWIAGQPGQWLPLERIWPAEEGTAYLRQEAPAGYNEPVSHG